EPRSVALEFTCAKASVGWHHHAPPEFAASDFAFGNLEVSGKTYTVRLEPLSTAQFPQQRKHVHQEAHENGDGIAREPDDNRVSNLAEHHGTARLDVELPEMSCAQTLKYAGYMIFLP